MNPAESKIEPLGHRMQGFPQHQAQWHEGDGLKAADFAMKP